jgi:RNA polymerase-binding transcription factor DksA
VSPGRGAGNRGTPAGPDYASGVPDTADFPPDALLLDQVNDELGAVDEALRRLDEGTYGTCEVCGSRLDPEQLKQDPLMTRCPGHPV